jgi:hypothetical protein
MTVANVVVALDSDDNDRLLCTRPLQLIAAENFWYHPGCCDERSDRVLLKSNPKVFQAAHLDRICGSRLLTRGSNVQVHTISSVDERRVYTVP